MTLAGGQPGDAPWTGQWADLAAGPGPGISLTVKATTATIVKISGAH
jgi:hypothetical protein